MAAPLSAPFGARSRENRENSSESKPRSLAFDDLVWSLLNTREFIVLGILAISVLLIGLWPAPLVDMMNTSIEQLILQVSQSKL